MASKEVVQPVDVECRCSPRVVVDEVLRWSGQRRSRISVKDARRLVILIHLLLEGVLGVETEVESVIANANATIHLHQERSARLAVELEHSPALAEVPMVDSSSQEQKGFKVPAKSVAVAASKDLLQLAVSTQEEVTLPRPKKRKQLSENQKQRKRQKKKERTKAKRSTAWAAAHTALRDCCRSHLAHAEPAMLPDVDIASIATAKGWRGRSRPEVFPVPARSLAIVKAANLQAMANGTTPSSTATARISCSFDHLIALRRDLRARQLKWPV
ncbi:hypothetical protein CYLTODRAFT_482994 [Cylindrobasidium torrendii FP15055 ss-10]|uniref:Uncharacterized protein n=1 Tax=Cylindrobasidium torrendii FP15055 ss-10 TaxID=1314674 RepID=A0A0D7AR08_9AGAR|nr:hypothetical protein CYLTODRAFT_482994 [Cylindrobasidium torrendii FP15055 ss-10]